jgi:hypothetical protein
MTPLAAAFGLILAAVWGGAPAEDRAVQPTEYVRLELRGTLTTGIAAIGGETTGTILAAKRLSWELELRSRTDLVAKADALAGESVVVKGTLEPRAGVETRRMRLIVVVESLERAPKPDAR